MGLPGQTLQIRNNVIYLDGKPNPQPANVQFAYEVTFKQDMPVELKKELGITDEDLYTMRNGQTVWMPLTNAVYLSGTCPNRKNPRIVEKIICE